MKRYSVLGAILAGLVIFLLCWRRYETARIRGDVITQIPAAAQSNNQQNVSKPPGENITGDADAVSLVTKASNPYEKLLLERPDVATDLKIYPDVPIAFYGLVVDQDTNGLANVKVDVEITQWNIDTPAESALKIAYLARQTDADGRFEVSGLDGHTVIIKNFTKEGYEPERWRREYGVYDARAGSVGQPMVFRLWKTNLHEPLITGEKKFEVVPDGRRYGIDLVNGTVVEGNEGDLVVWIQRSEAATRRYDWLCELAIPAGGLVEHSYYEMFRAPEAGYAKSFGLQQRANTNGWSNGFANKRFYLRLRSGQMYGRMVIDLHTDTPAMIRLSYAVNPSASRILR